MVTKMVPRQPSLGKVQISELNILSQARKTFDNIVELAEDITTKGGMLMTPIVARYDEQHMVRYLEVLNQVYGSSHELQGLISQNGVWYVLLAGERRTRAYRYLVDAGEAVPWYWADVRVNIDPVAALEIQLAENTHRRVPPHEEADAVERLFRFEQTHQKATLRAFAKRVGWSEHKIRSALKFCSLPQKVQELVRDGYLSYGMSVTITRLARVGVTEEQLFEWALTAITHRLSQAELQARVDHYLLEQEQGQTSLLSIFDSEQGRESTRAAHRRVVAANVLRAHIENQGYLARVLSLLESGKLAQAHSPYAEGSPQRRVRAEVDLLARVAAHLLKSAGKSDRRAQRLLELLEETFQK